jgi:hypothetical protein
MGILKNFNINLSPIIIYMHWDNYFAVQSWKFVVKLWKYEVIALFAVWLYSPTELLTGVTWRLMQLPSEKRSNNFNFNFGYGFCM